MDELHNIAHGSKMLSGIIVLVEKLCIRTLILTASHLEAIELEAIKIAQEPLECEWEFLPCRISTHYKVHFYVQYIQAQIKYSWNCLSRNRCHKSSRN